MANMANMGASVGQATRSRLHARHMLAMDANSRNLANMASMGEHGG
jgi:hypothetical protein